MYLAFYIYGENFRGGGVLIFYVSLFVPAPIYLVRGRGWGGFSYLVSYIHVARKMYNFGFKGLLHILINPILNHFFLFSLHIT